MGQIERDPEYEWVPALKLTYKRGRQCGQCGSKFDYATTYGYCCSRTVCPMGFGSSGAQTTTGMSENGVG